MKVKGISARGFLFTWLALMALTASSFGLSYVPLGMFGTPVAIAIAGIKGTLVAVFFMELIEPRFSPKIVLVTGLTMLVLLAGLLAADVGTRPEPPLLPAGIH